MDFVTLFVATSYKASKQFRFVLFCTVVHMTGITLMPFCCI